MEDEPVPGNEEGAGFKAAAQARGRRLWGATLALLGFQVLIYLGVPKLIPYFVKPQVLLVATPVLIALALVNYLAYLYATWTCPACGCYPGADWRRLNPAPRRCRKCGVALTDAPP